MTNLTTTKLPADGIYFSAGVLADGGYPFSSSAGDTLKHKIAKVKTNEQTNKQTKRHHGRGNTFKQITEQRSQHHDVLSENRNRKRRATEPTCLFSQTLLKNYLHKERLCLQELQESKALMLVLMVSSPLEEIINKKTRSQDHDQHNSTVNEDLR